ncbi:hypothetical protein ACLKA6_017812 [Drosophila palustris]
MSDSDSSDLEKLALEPSMPLLALSEFYGGNQLPTWNMPSGEFLLRKSVSVAPMLLKIWQQNDAQDLLIKLGTRQMQCNRLRLMCHSKYASRALTGGRRELELPEDRVTWPGLERVCRWIRQPEALLERRHIMMLLAAAIFLEMDGLVNQIWYCLDLALQFHDDQAFVASQEALGLRSNLPYTGLDRSMLRRIECFFLTLVASVEFVQLPVDHICCLLGSERIAANSEKEVFFAAIRWLTHDWPTRAKHVLAIMPNIRLVLLPPDFLLALHEPTDEELLNVIIALPDFQQILSEACSDQTFLYSDDGTQSYSYLFDSFEMSLPVRRPFICHDLCSYHRQFSDEFIGDFSYKQFLSYLRVLQNERNSWKLLRSEQFPWR